MPNNTNKPLYCYFGHPKCAGTWMSGFFLGVFHELGLKSFQHQLTLIDNPPKFIQEKNLDVLLSQNSSYFKVETLNNYKGIHLIRDPRDISVSAYFSYRNTHAIGDWKALGEIRKN